MCNWRSASPSGFAPHTPTSPSPPAAPPLPPPSSSPALPPLPASPAAVVGVVSASAVTKPLVFQPSCPLIFFSFFFFFCRSLRRHKITEAVLTSLSGWPNTLPFSSLPPSSSSPPPALQDPSHSGLRKLSATHYTKKEKKIQVFRLQQTAHENKHFPASSTWQ